MKERLTSRKIVHLTIVLAILLSPDDLSDLVFGPAERGGEGNE